MFAFWLGCANPARVAEAPNPETCRLSSDAYAAWTQSVDSTRLAELPQQVDREIAAGQHDTATYSRAQIIAHRLSLSDQLASGNNWQRTGFYLWTDADGAQRIAADLGFPSGYYFASFLSTYPYENACRERLLSNMRDSVYAHKGDSAVYRLDDRALLATSFQSSIDKYRKHDH